MTPLRETCNAIRALLITADGDWDRYYVAVVGSPTARFRWTFSHLRTTCGLCGGDRWSHGALHMVHAQRRVACKRARRRGVPPNLDDVAKELGPRRSFGSCLFVPTWAVLLGIR
jgi:hypothetical protein